MLGTMETSGWEPAITLTASELDAEGAPGRIEDVALPAFRLGACELRVGASLASRGAGVIRILNVAGAPFKSDTTQKKSQICCFNVWKHFKSPFGKKNAFSTSQQTSSSSNRRTNTSVVPVSLVYHL